MFQQVLNKNDEYKKSFDEQFQLMEKEIESNDTEIKELKRTNKQK